MTDTTTSAHPQPGKTSIRPSFGRILASWYMDVLICSLAAWIACYSFGIPTYWTSLALLLFFAEFIWCRDRLHPTAGEFCLGIRYLTSSSSQVVADIQVVNPKQKLNSYLLIAGVGEFSMAIFCFGGWTFLDQAVIWGIPLSGVLSLLYWVVTGLAFFFCSSHLLSGSKHTLWSIPLVHAALGVDFLRSAEAWSKLWSFATWPPFIAHFLRSPYPHWIQLFGFWSIALIVVIFLSRKHLVQ